MKGYVLKEIFNNRIRGYFQHKKNLFIIGVGITLPYLVIESILMRYNIIVIMIVCLVFGIINFICINWFIHSIKWKKLLNIAKEDKSFVIVGLISFSLSIPLLIFYIIFFSEETLFDTLLSPMILLFLPYLMFILLSSFLFLAYTPILISAIFFLPIEIIFRIKKKDSFIWLVSRKLKNKNVYQAIEFIGRISFRKFFSTSIFYLISLSNGGYVLFSIISRNGENSPQLNSFEIYLSISIFLAFFGSVLFWAFFRRHIIIYEIGLVEKNKRSGLFKRIDSSLIEKTIISSIPLSLILTILLLLPELSNFLMNIHLYLETIILAFIIYYLFILEILIFYYLIRSDDEYNTQTDNILKLNNIKIGYLSTKFIEKIE